MLLEKQTNAIETFDCFMASKKVIQCTAIIIPTSKVLIKTCLEIFKENLIVE